jgi:TonB family protein
MKVNRSWLTVLGLLFCFHINAQSGQENVTITPDSVKYTNRNCEYPGKMDGLIADVQKKLVIPKSVIKDELHGKVFLRVTIDPLGQPINPIVVQGVRTDIDAAVVQMTKKLHRFIPAMMDGKRVTTSILIPVSF